MRMTITGIEKAIHDKRGNVSAVARSFGVSRNAVQRRIDGNERLQEALREARETMLDNAERTLYDEATDGNTTALIFFLKTQGKSRGYIERQEHTGADGGAINIAYVNDWRTDQND